MKTFDLRKTSIQQFCTRPVNTIEVDDSVEKICLDVKNRGDRAIFEYALKFAVSYTHLTLPTNREV